MFLFQRTDTERKAVFTDVASQIGVRADMAEKDYWVSFVLNKIFADRNMAEIFWFKGGTSLSKAYRCINRFSEDIDLLLKLSEVAEPSETFDRERSANAINTFKSKVRKQTTSYISEKIIPHLELMLNGICTLRQDQDDPNNIFIRYPSVFSSLGYIRPEIKLEIGAFAEGTPFAPAKVNSYVADIYPQLAEDTADIPTVSIARTFWEKVTVLHYLYFLPEDRATPSRHSRHFYDIYKLFQSSYQNEILQSASLLDSIISFDRKFYTKRGVNYDSISTDTLRLYPSEARMEALRKDYEQMGEMIFGTTPSWNELMDFCKKLERQLHS